MFLGPLFFQGALMGFLLTNNSNPLSFIMNGSISKPSTPTLTTIQREIYQSKFRGVIGQESKGKKWLLYFKVVEFKRNSCTHEPKVKKVMNWEIQKQVYNLLKFKNP